MTAIVLIDKRARGGVHLCYLLLMRRSLVLSAIMLTVFSIGCGDKKLSPNSQVRTTVTAYFNDLASKNWAGVCSHLTLEAQAKLAGRTVTCASSLKSMPKEIRERLAMAGQESKITAIKVSGPTAEVAVSRKEGKSSSQLVKQGEKWLITGKEAAAQAGKTARLYFYDWETNVLGPGCKPAPTDAAVTGGSSAGSGAGALTQYAAVQRAAGCPQTNTGKETTTGSHYLVNDKTKIVLAGPQETKDNLNAEITTKKIAKNTNTSTLEVKAGAVVIQATELAKGPKKYYVLNDDSVISDNNITDPKQSFTNGAGADGAPTVDFSFSDKGETIYTEMTRNIAQRGQDNFFGGDARKAFQHFAIVLDRKLISTPYIDFQQNPDGIDGSNGLEISGDFTIQTAQELVKLLLIDALPIKLDLIATSSG